MDHLILIDYFVDMQISNNTNIYPDCGSAPKAMALWVESHRAYVKNRHWLQPCVTRAQKKNGLELCKNTSMHFILLFESIMATFFSH